jgi:AcrR family transcriptional regulator
MGRRKEHGERTRAALLREAERIVAEEGVTGLSVRSVADRAGTTTRAVYSLFGSKEGLLAAVAAHAFEVLREGLEALPETDDPVADLIDVGAVMYRRFVLEHPSLYRLAFQRIAPDLRLGPEFHEARARTWPVLEAKVRRLQDAGLLSHTDVRRGAVEFNAMCEGLAGAELRGGTLRLLPPGQEERVWREAFETLLRGFSARG